VEINWRRLLLIVLALAAITAAFAPGVEARERRLTAEIAEPFVINGMLYPAGPITIRQIGDYNPSETLNEIRAGDESIGVLRAAEIPVSQRERSSSLLFERDPKGTLVLTGFVHRGQRPRVLTRFVNDPGEEVLLAVR
jgi:hypothetical protein